MSTPILFMDGEPHRQQRAKVARYFAPKTVATRYHLHGGPGRHAHRLHGGPTGRLDRADPPLRRSRLRKSSASPTPTWTRWPAGFQFFDEAPFDLYPAGRQPVRFQAIRAAIAGNLPMLAYLADVRPAIVARHQDPKKTSSPTSSARTPIPASTSVRHLRRRRHGHHARVHLLGHPTSSGRRRCATATSPSGLNASSSADLRLEPWSATCSAEPKPTSPSPTATEPTIPKAPLGGSPSRPTPTAPRRRRRICPGPSAEGRWRGRASATDPTSAPATPRPARVRRVPHRLLGHDLELVTEPHLEWDELIAGYALRGFREIAVDPAGHGVVVTAASQRRRTGMESSPAHRLRTGPGCLRGVLPGDQAVETFIARRVDDPRRRRPDHRRVRRRHRT